MRPLAEVLLAGLFVSWLLATALCQAPSRVQNRLRKADVFGLIPRWHFFAPRPGTQDFVLVFRDQASSGSLSRWREAPRLPVSRLPLCALWNPGRRHTKAMIDITVELMNLVVDDRNKKEIELSVPYLALLNHISGLPRLDGECLTQFALVATQSSASTEPPEVVFVSSMHAIG
ncbi:hypothetical protein ACFYST_03485 [Kitasatospora sp. NPDC004614]|uniref:hypothetical protein n=1 Tax=unclassified Kitasatospora TaxID=2633591 RepID=UPI0036A32EE2